MEMSRLVATFKAAENLNWFNLMRRCTFRIRRGLAIAGGSTDFVNKVLENVKNGQPQGGLEELRNT
ncbi:hypothetical protein FF38_04573 [Lucilia cuprina]|uniref:Uncharacterized protein n=1 Tax=Lucilia cuprina TaxID=7375 RepID=A0A0L0BYK9_LUCCU|nr:hypothetical protein FF38_04573 [Lucilia cuprina]